MKTLKKLTLPLVAILFINGCQHELPRKEIYIPKYQKKIFKKEYLRKRKATINGRIYLLLTAKETRKVITTSRERLKYIRVLTEVIASIETQIKVGDSNESKKI